MRVILRCDPALAPILPPPVAARDALPEWLRAMPRHAASPLHDTEIRTVKHCPPFVDAMGHGFVIPLPCDVHVAEGRLSWNWKVPRLAAAAHPRAPVSFHSPAQVEGTPMHQPGQVVVKFNAFWTVELEPGWSLLATHPANRFDLPFRLLTGLVDADRFHDVGILFPALWIDPRWTGVLERGTPIAQCVPVPRTPLELALGTFAPEDARRYAETADALLTAPHVYRRRFRAPRSGSGGPAPDELRAQPLGIEEQAAAGSGHQSLGDPPEGGGA